MGMCVRVCVYICMCVYVCVWVFVCVWVNMGMGMGMSMCTASSAAILPMHSICTHSICTYSICTYSICTYSICTYMQHASCMFSKRHKQTCERHHAHDACHVIVCVHAHARVRACACTSWRTCASVRFLFEAISTASDVAGEAPGVVRGPGQRAGSRGQRPRRVRGQGAGSNGQRAGSRGQRQRRVRSQER